MNFPRREPESTPKNGLKNSLGGKKTNKTHWSENGLNLSSSAPEFVPSTLTAASENDTTTPPTASGPFANVI